MYGDKEPSFSLREDDYLKGRALTGTPLRDLLQVLRQQMYEGELHEWVFYAFC